MEKEISLSDLKIELVESRERKLLTFFSMLLFCQSLFMFLIIVIASILHIYEHINVFVFNYSVLFLLQFYIVKLFWYENINS